MGGKTMTRKKLSLREGFTLAEMVIVMVVIAILSGAVTVSIKDADQTSRVSVAAGRALSDLRYAQEVAMTERREVNFTVSGNTYSATYRDTGVLLPSPMDKSKNLQVTLNTYDGLFNTKGVSITSGLNGTITFTVDGKPVTTAGAELPTQTSIMNLNNKQNLVLFNSGYSVINPVAGACGGCGC
jgi:prepilin-type N-terminal cleavage/methylation domain-containing protein